MAAKILRSGKWSVRFTAPNGRRRVIALSLKKEDGRKADVWASKLESLIGCRKGGIALDPETAVWVQGFSAELRSKFEEYGLLDQEQPRENAILKRFLDDYIKSRTDVKPSTRRHLTEAAKKLVDHFGAEKLMTEINREDAEEFRRFLLVKLGENTARRMCGRARQFFLVAVRKRILTENPFDGLKGLSVRPNPSRMFFITPEMTEKLIDAAPDWQWRLIIALARYGGLRNPSETLALKWEDVLWSENKIRVRSPKTEHHFGGESRMIPIFPELRPHIEDAWELTENKTEFLITRYRSAEQNLRTTFLRIVKLAGLKPWPKLFQNLRSSRETELAECFPMQVVCAWIGNSQPVAMKHYMQVTEEHFERAVAESSARRFCAGNGHASVVQPQNDNSKVVMLQDVTKTRETVRKYKMPSQGLEP